LWIGVLDADFGLAFVVPTPLPRQKLPRRFLQTSPDCGKQEIRRTDLKLIEVDVFMVACSMLTQSRHKLVAEAVFWGADYMLWLDADHVFPPDTLARLWARNLPIVGCNYARRCTPTAPTASAKGEDDLKSLVYTTPEKVAADLVEEVDHIGFGVCLIDMRIFDVLQAKAEDELHQEQARTFELRGALAKARKEADERDALRKAQRAAKSPGTRTRKAVR
jgi:hypothetical protein